ncbi:MAG: DUF1016 N-terminal domain-containing protein [Isosphaeraceae bacterium]
MAKKRPKATEPVRAKGKEASNTLPGDYAELLVQIKERIQAARLRASLAVNRELVLLYWHIGREILGRQEAGRLGDEGHRPPGGRPPPRLPRETGLSPRGLQSCGLSAKPGPTRQLCSSLLH